MKFEPHWEKPVKAVLDYFNLENVSMVGVSWGGYFALRSAAKDKRIKNVIAYNICYDGLEVMLSNLPKFLRKIIKIALKLKMEKFLNYLVSKGRKKNVVIDWAISHGNYITGTNGAYEFFNHIKQHTLKGIEEEIESNVLLTAGEKDHYIPIEQYYILMNKIKNAKSKTGRIFTVKEGGEQHCQVGNTELALEYMKKWKC